MNPLVLSFFLSGLLLATIHALGIFFYLYWYYPWLDLVSHTIGGFFILTALGTAAELSWLSPLKVRQPLIAISVLMAGMIAWELFEYFAGFSDVGHPNFFIDTIIDLLMGTIGGMLGYAVLRSSLSEESTT